LNQGVQIKRILIILFQTVLLSQSIPYFDSDKAFSYLELQCDFGPRFPGSQGHLDFKNYLTKFLKGNNPDTLIVYEHDIKHPYIDKEITLYNFLARYNLKSEKRIMLMAHWDTREIADRDKNIDNHNKPILGANDGASGISILMVLSEILAENRLNNIGVDLLFIDGEDMGRNGELENYCLGTTRFCEVLPSPIPMYAICLDMVADKDPSFPVESFSWMQAPDLVLEVWSLAKQLGYEEFKMNIVAPIYDDHRALTLNSGIPAIDIIDFDYPYWHTLDDIPANCSASTLKIVGNLMSEFIYRKEYEIK